MNIPSARVEKFVSGEESKYTLNQAWLDVEGQRLLATDGHRAIRLSVRVDDGDSSGLVPSEVFELARKELKVVQKMKGKESLPDPWVRVICGQDFCEIENLLTNTKHFVSRPKLKPDQKFADIDAVAPKKLDKVSVTLNRVLLAEILGAIDGGLEDVSLWIDAADKVVTLAAASGSSIVFLMPMRMDMDSSEVLRRGKKAEMQVAAD